MFTEHSKASSFDYKLLIFGSVVDPDPHSFWSAEYGSRSRRAKISRKSKVISSFEVLDVLF
jgi:hypothetical protein